MGHNENEELDKVREQFLELGIKYSEGVDKLPDDEKLEVVSKVNFLSGEQIEFRDAKNCPIAQQPKLFEKSVQELFSNGFDGNANDGNNDVSIEELQVALENMSNLLGYKDAKLTPLGDDKYKIDFQDLNIGKICSEKDIKPVPMSFEFKLSNPQKKSIAIGN